MVRPLVAATFALSLLMASSAGARVWNDPTGRYSLDLARLGWESQPPPHGYYLAVVSSAARARDKFLTCEARVLGPIPFMTWIDQARVNEVGTSPFNIRQLLSFAPDAIDPRVERANIDGIELVDLRFTTAAQGGLHHHWRTFYLATPEGVVQHQIQCGGAMPLAPEDDADIDALLGTLRFIPQG